MFGFFTLGENVILPRPMLTSRSLEELGLFSFPKTLSLQLMYVTSAFLETIISGCQRLENLNLHYCWITCSGISSRVLRNLVVENCELQIQWKNKLYICTPNLVHLHFNQKYAICWPPEELYKQYHRPFKQDFRHLKLDVLNLKSLILGGFWVASEPGAVPFFLRHSPMLEMLTLIYSKGTGFGEFMMERNPDPIRSDLCFQCKKLTSVDIICRKTDESIEKLTEVLMRSGIANVNLTVGDLSSGDDSLKMLYDVLYWVQGQMFK